MRAKPELIDQYVQYLVREIHMKHDLMEHIETIYIGGGTPSILSKSQFSAIFQALYHYIKPEQMKEFTIEANPNDITAELLSLLHNNHVNRLSLGIQSFHQQKLNILNRKHTKEQAVAALKLCQDFGFDNINVDIMFGVGSESVQDLKHDLTLAIQYGAKHISLYSLILEDRTVLDYLRWKGQFQEMDDDLEEELYFKAQHYLETMHFYPYEISNYCLSGYECLHNLTYWNNEHYLGIGAGASYYIENKRYTNIKNLNAYFFSIDQLHLQYEEEIELSIDEQMKEHLMLGLRKIKGIDIKSFNNRYQTDIMIMFPVIHELIKKDLLSMEEGKLFIPQSKLFLSNEVLIHFV